MGADSSPLTRRLQGDDYEAWSEMQANGAWTTMFKVKMVRTT